MSSFNKYLVVCLGLIALPLSAVTLYAAPARSASQDKEATKDHIEPKKEPKLPEGSKQLKPMFLDKTLFIPDKWWKYEEADDDRPFSHSVEQMGSVAIGATLEEKHGAFVRYRVTKFVSVEEARKAFVTMSKIKKVVSNVSQKSRPLHKGNEGVENKLLIRDLKGSPQEQFCYSYIRFDQYLVQVDSRSDMRALGPRPSTGNRKWMSEPVYESVMQAAMDRWAKYKVLLAKSK